MCLTDLIAASDPPPTALAGAATPVAPGRSSPVERDHPHARASVTSGRSWAWAGFPAMPAEETFTLPSGHTLSKLSPLAEWTTRDVWYYAEAHGIPLLPLYEKGYTSIGCAPCTSLPFDPSDPRSGRWAGQKLECGIHIQAS